MTGRTGSEDFSSSEKLQASVMPQRPKQISTLLYCLGEEAEAVLMSTNETTEDQAGYKKVLEKFDSFFQVRKTSFMNKSGSNHRNQQSRETAEQYIMILYEFVEHCEYRDMKEQLSGD